MPNFVKTKSFELAVYAKGSEKAEKLALILPGRLDTKDYPHIKSHVDFLAGKGYQAISFDPPGTWESKGGIEIYSMTNYLKAINELVEHLGNKSTLLMGHSRGGTIALLAGTRNDCVTQMVSVFSHPTPSKPREETREKGFETTWRDDPGNPEKKIKFDLPFAFFQDALNYNPVEALSKCGKPKLFFLAKRDEITPPQEIREMFKKASEPKRLRELDSTHDYRYKPELIGKVNEEVWEFLQENE
jgi:pimeloyl-ACP methyl ester carboxylesterase